MNVNVGKFHKKIQDFDKKNQRNFFSKNYNPDDLSVYHQQQQSAGTEEMLFRLFYRELERVFWGSPRCGCGETITFGIGITYGFGRDSPSSRDYSGRCSAPHIHLRLNTSADKQLAEQKQRETRLKPLAHIIQSVISMLYN